MKIPGLTEEDLTDVARAFQSVPEIEKAVLFGSRAKGTAKRGSDVDLALVGSAVNRSALVELSMVLNEETLLPYRFDLLDYQTIDNPALKEHIDRVGIVIFDRMNRIEED